ncbi:MAG: hypothetical protein ACI8XC_004604, partial [Gammaproteobacteria bacterium]
LQFLLNHPHPADILRRQERCELKQIAGLGRDISLVNL